MSVLAWRPLPFGYFAQTLRKVNRPDWRGLSPKVLAEDLFRSFDFVLALWAMPMIAISEAEAAQGRKNMEPEFEAVLQDHSVDDDVIALFGHFGIKRMRTFSKIAKDEDSVRKWLEDDLQLKPRKACG